MQPTFPQPSPDQRIDAGPPGTPKHSRRNSRRGRPAFGLLAVVIVVARIGREVLDDAVIARFGFVGLAALVVGFLAIVFGFRAVMRRRARAGDGLEFTPEMIRQQLAASELTPAFEGDGTVLGAPLLVVNQRSKLIEVVTEYAVFDHLGEPLASVRQIGQGRFKRVIRFIGSLDQFFTHHFDIVDRHGALVLRLTRPRKVFKSRVNVYDAHDVYLGCIRQLNVFGKIDFAVEDASSRRWALMKAQNWRAWDFQLVGTDGRVFAEVIKSWEGWARTFLTNADRYVAKVHMPLPEPLRSLTLAWVLTIDLALKQDARGLGGG